MKRVSQAVTSKRPRSAKGDRRSADLAAKARLAEAQFQAFVEATSDVVYRMSPDWSEMRQLVGRGFIPDTTTGSLGWIDRYVPLSDQPSAKEAIARAIEAKGVFELQHRVLRVDGTLGWTYSRAVPILGPDGEVIEWLGTARDVTELVEGSARRETDERKVAEAALQASEVARRADEARFRTVVETAADGIVVLRGEQIEYANAAAGRIFGLKCPEDLVGRSVLDLVAPERRAELLERLVNLGKGDRVEPLELTLLRPDGTTIDVVSTPTYFEDAKGRAVLGLLHDVTAERAAAKVTVERKEELEALIDTAMDGVYFVDMAGKIVGVNEAACAIDGYSRDEMLKMSVHDLEVAETPAEVLEHLRKARSAGKTRFNSRHRRKDGRIIEIEVSLQPTDGGGTMVAFVRDVTRQMHYEGALHESERRYRALANLSPDAVLTHRDGWIDFANQEALRLLGASRREQVIGRPVTDFLLPGDQALIEEGQREALADRPTPFVEHRVLRLDGGLVEVESGASLVHEEQGPLVQVVLRDITERKKASRELKAAEERLRLLFVSMAEGVVQQDLSGAIISCNPAAERILGLTAEQMAGRTSIDPRWKAVHEDGSPFSGETHPAMVVLRSSAPVRDVVMGVHKPDGALTWILANAEPVRGQDGTLAGAVTTFTDVTQRMAAEAALQRRDEELSGVFTTPAVGMAITDPGGGFVRFNEAFCAMVGYSSNEMLRLRWEQFTHPEDVQRDREKVAQVLSGALDRFTHEKRYIRKDGSVVWGLVSVSPIRGGDGKVTHLVAIVTDISRRKEMELALRQSEQRMALVLENARDGVNMLDLKTGKYVFMSLSQVAMTGFTEDEIRNMSAEEAYDRCHPEDRHISVEQQASIAAGAETLGTVEYRWKVKSGEYRWFSDSRKVVRDEAGNAVALVGVSRDITERKRAEEALAASEARFRALADKAPVGIFETDAQGASVYTNSECARIMAMPAADSRGEGWIEAIHPDDREFVRERWTRAAKGGTVFSSEHRYVHRDGQILTAMSTATPLRDARGRLGGYIGVIIDITPLHDAEAALRESTARLEAALQGSRDGLVDIDLRTGKTYRSPRYWEIAGWPEGSREATTGSFLALVHPDDLPLVKPKVDAILASEAETLDAGYRLRRSDGDYVWVRARLRSVERDRAGKTTRIAGVISDISDLVAAQESLRASELRFRTLADASPVGIFESNARGENVYLNPAAAEILGQSAEAALGKGWEEAIHPDDRERVFGEWYQAVAERRPYTSEHRFLRPDGQVAVMRAYANAIRGGSGDVAGYVGVMIDVTAQKRMEQQLAVSSRLGVLGTLVAGVGHEINNPLAAIMAGEGFALDVVRGLLGELRSSTPPSAREVAVELDEIVEPLEDGVASGGRIAQIVKDLAMFSNSRKGKELTQLRSVVDVGLRWLPASIGSAADVIVDDRGTPEVEGRPGQLSQVVLNLVSNACRAGRDGKPPKVTVRLATGADGRAVLEVEDDGVGMTPEVQEKIFDPFFTTRPAGDLRGAGLGLSVCHAVVTDHGGTITVKSEPGKGSIFTVELPAFRPEA